MKFLALFKGIVGSGPAATESELGKMVEALGLKPYFRFLGNQSELSPIYNALDVVTLCSKSEAFPNVLIESLAIGTLCVASRVGDIPRIVTSYEYLLDTESSEELAQKWDWISEMTPEQRKEAVKAEQHWVQERFTLERMVSSTRTLIFAKQKENLLRLRGNRH